LHYKSAYAGVNSADAADKIVTDKYADGNNEYKNHTREALINQLKPKRFRYYAAYL